MSASELAKAADDLRGNRLNICLERMERLKQFNPYSIEYYINIGTIHAINDKKEEALQHLKKAKQYDPFDFRPYYNMFVVQQSLNNHMLAAKNLSKCMSIIYTLNQQYQRALELWKGNTAAHVLKIVKLIKQERIDEANQAIDAALSQCKIKSHIMTVAGILDAKLSRKIERQQNIQNHNPHLLYRVSSSENIQTKQDNISTSHDFTPLIQQFNKLNKLYISQNIYESYVSHPQVIFMKVNNHTTMNIDKYITDNLGTIQPLSSIKQESNMADDKEEKVATIADNVYSNQIQKQQTDAKQIQANNLQTKFIDQKQMHKQNQKLMEHQQQSPQQKYKKQQQEIQKQKQNEEQQQQQDKQYKEFKQQKVNKLNVDDAKQKQQVNSVKKQENNENENAKDQAKASTDKQILLYPVSHPNFEVKLVMADLQINQELIGKMDPYVYYEYGFQKHKSTIAKGQGLKPRWVNEVKIFSLERNPSIMKVSIYDREIFKWDDLVGTGQFQVMREGLHKIPIYLKQKQTGIVVFYITKKI